MTDFFKTYTLGIIGIILGAVAGYAYYYFIGCNSGTCAITSKPFNSTAYGMVLGYLMFSTFEKTKKQQEN